MKFLTIKAVLISLLILLLSKQKAHAQYYFSIDPGLSYTLVHQKYIRKDNKLRYLIDIDLMARIGLTFGYKLSNERYIGLDFTWNDFDFGRKNNTYMRGGSFGFSEVTTNVYNFLPSIGFWYRKDWRLTKNSYWTTAASIGLGYYIEDKLIYNDTSWFNSSISRRDYDVKLEKIDKGSSFVPMIRLLTGYKIALGRGFSFNPSIMYQLGFANYITFRYKMQYKYETQSTIVENSLRGSSLQFLLKFEYQFKKREKIRYLIK